MCIISITFSSAIFLSQLLFGRKSRQNDEWIISHQAAEFQRDKKWRNYKRVSCFEVLRNKRRISCDNTLEFLIDCIINATDFIHAPTRCCYKLCLLARWCHINYRLVFLHRDRVWISHCTFAMRRCLWTLNKNFSFPGISLNLNLFKVESFSP